MVNSRLPDPMVNRRMPQYKKHKTWDGDAVLVLNGAKGTMYDLEGKLYVASFYYNMRLNVSLCSIGAGSLNAPGAEEGGEYVFGGKEVGIDHSISRADYLSGKCFGRGSKVTSSTTTPSTSTIQKQFVPLKPSNLAIPYKTPTRDVVDLQPVNLLSGPSNTPAQEPRGSKSYWTANWYACNLFG
jgi:DNA repair and recombination protein RAD54B